MNPQPKHRRIDIPAKMARLLARKARFYCAYGGRASGKSWSFALCCLVAGTRKQLKIVGMRETLNSIKDSSYTLMIDWIGRVPELAQHYRVEANRIFGKNGTEILFKGLKEDTASRIKSLEGVDICFVDEAQQVSQHSWDVLIPTIRKEGSIFLISWNPNSDTDPVWQEFGTGKRDSVALCEISYKDNPYCSQEMKDEAESCRAADPKAYDHIWLGKPQDQTDNQLIPTSLLVAAQTRQPLKGTGPIVLGVDPARFGSDATVIAVRKGRDIIAIKRHRGADTMEVVGRVIEAIEEYSPALVVVDEGGVGGGVVDRLKEQRYKQVRGVNFGQRSRQPLMWGNKRAEMWGAMRDWLKTASIPADRLLKSDLISPLVKPDSRGTMFLESKKDMRARGLQSPDAADAICVTFAFPVASSTRIDKTPTRHYAPTQSSWMSS